MVLDATRGSRQAPSSHVEVSEAAVKSLHPRIQRARILERALVVIQVDGEGCCVIKTLVEADLLSSVRLIAAVSSDVDLDDHESILWGIFTRFDPARDIVFTSSELREAWPVYSGCLGIDATFKKGYPDPVVMDPAIVKRVDLRWHQYFRA
jgi:4-hydroxy-3-polyprenylbenzoate decarboxylase